MREKGLKWLSLMLFSILFASLFVARVNAPPDPTVFFDPPAVKDPTHTIGTFTVDLNISDVFDLYAWEAHLVWDPTVLNLSSHMVSTVTIWHITWGDFMAGQPMLYPKIYVNWTMGYCDFGQTTVGADPGVTGSGWLATVEFTVVGYGATDLDIATGYPITTFLLDSNLWDIPMTPENGYFRNLHPGDVDADHYVGSADAGVLNGAYGTWRGDALYVREADFDDDTYIGSADAGILNGVYGTTYP